MEMPLAQSGNKLGLYQWENVHSGVVIYFLAMSMNTSDRSLRAWMTEMRSCCGIIVLRARARFATAAMTKSFGAAIRLVKYLYA